MKNAGRFTGIAVRCGLITVWDVASHYKMGYECVLQFCLREEMGSDGAVSLRSRCLNNPIYNINHFYSSLVMHVMTLGLHLFV